MSQRKLKQDWEDLGALDPMWAVLTFPERQYGRWTSEDFFETGARDVEGLMQTMKRLNYPSERRAALDFGCGVGRITRALSEHFDKCSGVDISEHMIARAREMNTNIVNCHFIVNNRQDLRIFSDNCFDLVYTYLVLMHLPSESMVNAYITEFIRVMKPNGLLVFQILTDISTSRKLQLRSRLYSLLRNAGLSRTFLYRRLRLSPMRAHCISEQNMRILLHSIHARVLEVEALTGGGQFQSRTFYVTK